MGRYTGPVCRICRREGDKLFLKGERCLSPKCAIEKRATPPGQHGQSRKKPSQYATQLREKQKMKKGYGLLETQFRNYFRAAARKKGVTGDHFIRLLESRLDNVIYRMGFAGSRRQARQLVSHGHIRVDGRKVNIASYLVRPGQEIGIREKSREIPPVQEAAKFAAARPIPSWLEVDLAEKRGRILAVPAVGEVDLRVREQLVVEFYSR
ncbi:MAG: 30S ribosomal protein S4 [Armatimonadetes bacterium]|nr:30S ribosomal protein S4 [Armatimonadota bacterium]